MATPLADLLSGLRTDIELRAEFAHAPREFLDAHGWAALDVADLREACYILADGSPPDDAAHWLTRGHALDTPDDDPATALLAAFEAIAPIAFDLDPAAMDGIDADESADDGIDESGSDPDDDAHEGAHENAADDADTGPEAQSVMSTWADSETQHDDPDDSPVIDAGIVVDDRPDPELDDLFDSDTATADIRDAGDFGDGWDEII
jgi:hypothetical protein